MIKFDKSKSFVAQHELDAIKNQVESAHEMIESRSGLGNDFLGWVDLPKNYDREEYERIKRAAKKIREKCEVLVVIGIGGSYLGARAVIEAMRSTFYNNLPKEKQDAPAVVFAGNNISPNYMSDILEYLEDKDFCVNVISKSGTTTEPAIAFRILHDLLVEKYPDDFKDRIFVTTDRTEGTLKQLADEEGYETFVVPDDIGGRYSVLSAVGLLPIAAAGIDIDELMRGAADAMEAYSDPGEDNACYIYAAIRNILYRKGKTIEILANYEPRLHYMAEWWKQLFGESEGKNLTGIFPAAVDLSTDLHSMGQYIQQGRRDIFETVVIVKEAEDDVAIPEEEKDLDGLGFLEGRTMNEINYQAFRGTLVAHADGGVPNLVIKLSKLDEYNIGSLIYFFEKACAVSGYILGVNPFDQPGVEDYKRNMFALLGKPGYEKVKQSLLERLKK